MTDEISKEIIFAQKKTMRYGMFCKMRDMRNVVTNIMDVLIFI